MVVMKLCAVFDLSDWILVDTAVTVSMAILDMA